MTTTQSNSEIETQAKYWLWRIEEGLSQQERQAFVAWVNQDNKHHLALHKYSPSLKMSKLLADFNGLFPLEKKQTNKSTALLRQFSLAASVIFLSILTTKVFLNKNVFSLFQETSTEIVNQKYSTVTSEQKTVTLPDGSLVQLNTNSLLTISFSENHRQLNLVKGEASFDVAKDKSRPFSVTSGEQSFTALGTIFNVQKSENNHLELIVTEGRVLIADSNESLDNLIEKIADTIQQTTSNNIIIANEKATIINKVQLPTSKMTSQSIFKELAWKKDMLIFEGESLLSALDEISRYTDLRFTIKDQELVNKKVSGVFMAGDIEALLDSISNNFDLKYTKTSYNTVIITKSIDLTTQTAKILTTH